MHFSKIVLAIATLALASVVSASPFPDNQVAGTGNATEWTNPVGYVCCKSIDRDGCHDCDYKKACPKDDASKCPSDGFCCGFPASAYPIETPTSTKSARTAARTTSPELAVAPKIKYRSAEEATAANAGSGAGGFPTLNQWCCSNWCRQCNENQGCANDGNCPGSQCCQLWTWE
ncbi:hypothetical protein N431DRAFT_559183 [Stipitochalara longipes BDJ]|nr:hypothetical protein N431DRAFT_559183 [Stipitochalara longipes BDJ]